MSPELHIVLCEELSDPSGGKRSKMYIKQRLGTQNKQRKKVFLSSIKPRERVSRNEMASYLMQTLLLIFLKTNLRLIYKNNES